MVVPCISGQCLAAQSAQGQLFKLSHNPFENENSKFWPNLATPPDQVNIF